VRGEPVFVEQVGVTKQLGELLPCLSTVGRAEEAEHDPAAGGDLQVEAAARHRGGTEPRDGIA